MSSSPPGATRRPDGDETGPDKRRTVVAFGALAVVAIGAGGYLFLGASGADEPPPAAAPAAAAPAAPADGAVVPVAATLPTPTDLTIGRNPFKVPGTYIAPVASPADAGTGAGTGTSTGTGGTGTSTGTGTGTGSGGTGTGSGGTGTGGTGTGGTGTPTPAAPTAPTAPTARTEERYKLILLRVFGEGVDQSASFSIDGSEQTAKVGSVFGPHAEILLLELTEAPVGTWTATLQVGDGDPFDVVVGEPAYVR